MAAEAERLSSREANLRAPSRAFGASLSLVGALFPSYPFSVWGHAWNKLAKSEAEEKDSRNRP